jgi:hypothetical protein
MPGRREQCSTAVLVVGVYAKQADTASVSNELLLLISPLLWEITAAPAGSVAIPSGSFVMLFSGPQQFPHFFVLQVATSSYELLQIATCCYQMCNWTHCVSRTRHYLLGNGARLAGLQHK